MKIALLSLSFLFFLSCKKEKTTSLTPNEKNDSLSTVQEPDSIKNDTIKTIADIKKEYAVISGLVDSKKLDSTTFNYYCNEREGEVTLYYQNKKLKMVKDFYAEHSHFSSFTKYFVKDDQVFFIFNDETVWNFDEGGTPEKAETKDDIKEKRIYILQGKAVQCFEKNYSIRSKGNNQDPNSVPNRETKCDISEYMQQYERIMKNKNKKGDLGCL